MAKGSGLSIDSDPFSFSLHHPIVLNSFQEDQYNHHLPPLFTTKKQLHHHHSSLMLMDNSTAIHRRSPPPPPPTTIRFAVNLNRSHDDDVQHSPDSPPPSNEQREVIDERDFFADSKNHLDHEKSVGSDDPANKMDLHGPTDMEFNVNTGLNLLLTNTSTDHSVAEDGIPSNIEDKRAKSELAVLQAELERLNVENQRLRGMLNQVTTNYNALQVHLLNLTQSQKADQNSSGAEGHRVAVEEKKLMNGNGSSLVVPRQFMDLGLAAKNGDADEHSESSSDERSRGERFGSLGDNVKAAGHSDDQRIGFDHEKKDFGRRIGREDSPDQPSQSWGLNKVPRLSSPKEKKAGPFGTVKGLLTNPSVLPDESVNPRLAKILEKVAVNRELIVALANSNVKEMLEVWFANINRVGISNYLVVALDDEIARFCELKNVPVYKRDPNKVIDSVASVR